MEVACVPGSAAHAQRHLPGHACGRVFDHVVESLETLRHKKEVLEGYCEILGRDPSTIELTMQAPGIVAATEREAESLLVHVPPDRRPHVTAGTPEQTAEALQPYLAAGFAGFTFNNTIYRTLESIARGCELLRLVAC